MRMMGSENEYYLLSRRDVTHDFIGALFREDAFQGELDTFMNLSKNNMWLSNGARYYIDVGKHPEYSCPPDWGALAATICDFSGIAVMRRHMADVREKLNHDLSDNMSLQKDFEAAALLRRVTNGFDSCGDHVNLMAKRSLEVNKYALAPVLLHMIGAKALFGAGHIAPNGNFEVSQKASYIYDYVNDQTTKNRPLINDRDEPHAKRQKWRRLHIVGNDSLFSPWTTWLRYATYDLTVALCESRPDIAAKMADELPPKAKLRSVLAAHSDDSETYGLPEFTERAYEEVQKAVKAGDIEVEGESSERVIAMQEWEFALDAMSSAHSAELDFLDFKQRKHVFDQIDDIKPDLDYSQKHMIDMGLDDMEKRKFGSKVYQETVESAGWDRLAAVFSKPKQEIIAAEEHREKNAPEGIAELRSKDIKKHKDRRPDILDKYKMYLDWDTFCDPDTGEKYVAYHPRDKQYVLVPPLAV